MVSRQFASAATASQEDDAFGRATIYVQSTFRVESVDEVPPDAFLPVPRRPAEILALHRHEVPLRQSDRHRLAVALATRGDLRVRDLAARLGRPPTSLPGRNQQRLQHLHRDALASIWEHSIPPARSGTADLIDVQQRRDQSAILARQ